MEDQEIRNSLEQNWGITPILIIPIQLGNALCWNITLSSGEKLFFKQMRPEIVGSETRIEEILQTQNYFASKGLPIVKPIQTVNGNLYLLNQGSFFIIYPFINSKQKIYPSELNQKNLDSLADNLAKLHIAGFSQQAPKVSKIFNGWKSPEKFNITISELRNHISQKTSLDELDKLILTSLNVKEKIINGAQIQYSEFGLESDHLTHGDYQERNVFFDSNDEVEWIIDFDACEMAPRSREIARAIDLLCIDRNDLSKEGLEKARDFFKRYNAIYPISTDELYKGWFAHFMKTGMSLFGYTEYYFNNDKRAIRFITDEKAETLETYSNNLAQIVDLISSN